MGFPLVRFSTLILDDWLVELEQANAFTIDPTTNGLQRQLRFPNSTVRVCLMDQSIVEFKNALFVVNENKRAIAVFTEHCGHHIFPYHESIVYVDEQVVYRQVTKNI